MFGSFFKVNRDMGIGVDQVTGPFAKTLDDIHALSNSHYVYSMEGRNCYLDFRMGQNSENYQVIPEEVSYKIHFRRNPLKITRFKTNHLLI